MSILRKLIKLIEKLKKRVRDPIQNNLKYNIPNIQGKYNKMVIPGVHSNNNSLDNN
ncbi:hypothetical protein H8356DRAFT_1359791 [Neocallimastix lanati (nom. inval.)]|nr:hypothetical protein H8356DRAFT_1359791 [Neocallimastix sp. JGI-2020a]